MILLACIVTISVVLFIHMGLSEKIQSILHIDLDFFKCCKCLTHWTTLCVLIYNGYSVLYSVGVSFIFAYVALWLELFLGYLSTLYDKIYGKIYPSQKGQTDKADQVS